MNDLAVVIVSYNVRYYLEQCLRSVARASEGLTVETWVVDNASPDGSVDYLRPRFPHVHFIYNKENVGFSRANNQAIRQTQSRYVLLLNPDTIITEHTLRDCITFLDADPTIGALGVAMYGSDGAFALESRRALPVPFTSLCKLTGLTALFPHSKTFGRYYMRFLPRDKASQIEVISGAFNMLRRKALDEIGLLDETFFMYGEDIDLSYRMRLGGWQNWYLPTPIIHYKGESTQKDTMRYVNIFYEAMIIFMEKHFRHRYHHATLLFRAGIYARAGVEYAKRMLRPLRAVLPHKEQQEWAQLMGSEAHLPRMKEQCERAGLCTGKCLDTIGYLVFDTSMYTYSEMIDYLVAHHKAQPHTHLATYDPHTRRLIFPNAVI